MDTAARASWFALQGWDEDACSRSRQRQAQWTWRKLRKARRWARVLRRVPGVRMIAVGNALGYGNCRDRSDIDLVVVAAPGHLWTVRLFVITILKVFRQRPGEHARDALCPSFFLTTEALNLEPLHIPFPVSDSRFTIHGSRLPPDPYLLFWPTQLTVLSSSGGTYEQLWDANRVWVERWLPDAAPRAAHPRFAGVRAHAARPMLPSVLGACVEWCARRIQAPRLQRTFPQANHSSAIVISNVMLKFHQTDRRAAFRDAWIARLHASIV